MIDNTEKVAKSIERDLEAAKAVQAMAHIGAAELQYLYMVHSADLFEIASSAFALGFVRGRKSAKG